MLYCKFVDALIKWWNSNDEATIVIKETLTEIEREQAKSKGKETQMIEQQVNMETSSSQTTEEKDLDIKDRYKQIKQRNEEIKSEIYSQFLKQKPGN